MEHRCGTRHSLDIAVRLDSPPSLMTFGRLLNVSASGGYVAAPIVLPAMSPISVQLEWGRFRDESQRIAGFVVRCDGRGIGIEWREFAPATVLALLEDLDAPQEPSKRCAAGGPAASAAAGRPSAAQPVSATH